MNIKNSLRIQTAHFVNTHVVRTWLILIGGTCSALLMTPIILAQLATKDSDYQPHIKFAQKMIDTGQIQTPHFLWHLLVAILSAATNQPLATSAMVVGFLSYFVLGSGITHIILASRTTEAYDTKSIFVTLLAVISLLIVSPVNLAAPVDRHLYFGYIGINVYHNPTMALMKPIAVISVVMILKYLPVYQLRGYHFLYISLVSLAVTLAKPNYSIILIIALPILMLYFYILNIRTNFIFFIITMASSVLTLLFQYLITYSSSDKSGIIFFPLDVMSHYSNYLFIKFLGSILFPTLVTVFYWQKSIADRGLIFSWLLFFAGASLAYLLSESGTRRYDGNFLWSAQIGLFFLFVFSMAFLFKQSKNDSLHPLARILIALSFLLHVFSGIYFYYTNYLFSSGYW